MIVHVVVEGKGGNVLCCRGTIVEVPCRGTIQVVEIPLFEGRRVNDC